MGLGKLLQKPDGTPVRVLILVANDIAFDGRVNKEALALIERGAEVTILGQSINPEEARGKVSGKPYEAIILQKSTQIKQPRLGREDIPRFIRIPVNLTVTKLIEFVYKIRQRNIKSTFSYTDFDFKRDLGEREFDLVQANDVYTLRDGYEIAKRLNAPFVADSYELFDGYFLSVNNGKRMQRASDALERQYLPLAEHVFSVAPTIKDYLEKKYFLQSSSVLLNSPRRKPAKPTEVHEPVKILDQCGLREAAGNMLILEAMPYLRDKATLTFQGRSVNQAFLDYLHQRASELKVEDIVTFAGPYEVNESVALANEFDIGVILHRPVNRSKDFALANRLFTYMMAGVAVLGSETTGHTSFPHFQEFGRTVKLTLENTPEANQIDGKNIANAIQEMIEDREKLYAMKQAANSFAEQHSFENQADDYAKVLKKVLADYSKTHIKR